MKFKSIEDNVNYIVYVNKLDSVHIVKKKLCSVTKLNLDKIILLHKNRILKNDKLIRDYNIDKNDFVLFGHEGMLESYHDKRNNNRDKKNYLEKFCSDCYTEIIDIEIEPVNDKSTHLNDDDDEERIYKVFYDRHQYKVSAKRNERICDGLAKKLAEKYGICNYNPYQCVHRNNAKIVLCCKGINLNFEKTFADYEIEDSDGIILYHRITGGGGPLEGPTEMTIKCINAPYASFKTSSRTIWPSEIINQISHRIKIPVKNIKLFLDENRSKKLRSSYVEINQEIDIYFYIKPNFDNLVKLEKLGKGSFGTVFKCISIETIKEIAVKKLNIPLTNDTKENKLSFERELQVYSKHSYHPRIVKYERNFQTENAIFLVMEYMKGGSLSSYLKKNGPLSENKIQKYAKQILEALQYLHEQKILHRDIKSDNILLDEEDNVKLCDFGLSKDLIDLATKDYLNGVCQSTVGTVNYMAPEIMNEEPYGPSADIWSFGATLVEMVTGFPPFYKMDYFRIFETISKSKKIEYNYPNNLSVNLKSFIDSCLQSEPSKRLTSNQLTNHLFLQFCS